MGTGKRRLGKYSCFSLTLMLTHDCNLRCTYCYIGHAHSGPMPVETGRKAIRCALASVSGNGTLLLGFFGGEPLLEAAMVLRLMEFAREQASANGTKVAFDLTTNGTVTSPEARQVMEDPDLSLAVSFDGLPLAHDRHRRTVSGENTSARVLSTIKELVDEGRQFSVVTVVNPDTVSLLPEGLRFLRETGVRHVEPVLNVWEQWSSRDIDNLKDAIRECAGVWKEGLPHFGVTWFDEKAAQIAHLISPEEIRCGFGDGEVSITPSGRLFPCERLIGSDNAEDPMRIPENLYDLDDFLDLPAAPGRSCKECSECAIDQVCGANCRCANYVRTGDVARPDRLLCLFQQTCFKETEHVLKCPVDTTAWQKKGGYCYERC